jgi:hypothetical protein
LAAWPLSEPEKKQIDGKANIKIFASFIVFCSISVLYEF